jgi:hypothetical protein
VLAATGNNKSQAAKILSINPCRYAQAEEIAGLELATPALSGLSQTGSERSGAAGFPTARQKKDWICCPTWSIFADIKFGTGSGLTLAKSGDNSGAKTTLPFSPPGLRAM